MFEVLATNEEVAIDLDPAYIAEVGIYHPQRVAFDNVGSRSKLF